MSLFRTILFVAALAGIGAGLVGSAIHLFTTVPLILAAETFEGAGEAPALATTDAHEHAPGTAAHSHDEEEWGPADGLERNGLTIVFTVLTGFGFALLLVAASEVMGGLKGWHQGLLWGLAGFAAFTLAPGLGLPPELPAMPAADLAARQAWWIATVAATAGGLALIAFGRSPLLAALGVALIVAPHVIGAPQPESHESPIPEALHHSFVVASVGASFVFWVLLGGLAGWLRPRFAAPSA
ncbi:CbtA family protein [Ancylobacter dichloromethanicus]|uniref:Cobalt transporter subunit CbtA n=1 Tax=Ancylobacter dichloromethanicus TaxID=518825 RepID=A0A9W6JBN4_9HYPH|nr:CbtA family protein [Ancylobacter dichloromethanicus]MBS7553605.1 CbtA family protein [Ancylobacter dichloromethanicus]GLK72668.1 cobalt transporter subunit CbtA [Ancylobacter dichloromethanicus]